MGYASHSAPGRTRARAALAGISAGLAALVAACDAGPPRRPNVLLLSLDSVRRDLLSAYGHRAPHAPDRATTPHLDRIAEEGVLMEDAYATTSWTLPSHVSIFTGQPELVHAVDLEFHRPDPGQPMLAEILRAHGYRTAGFYSGPLLEGHFGFARGFERYEAAYGPALREAVDRMTRALKERRDARARGDGAAESEARAAYFAAQREVERLSHRDVSAASVSDAVLAELERAAADERPFFVFAHYFDPHYDYGPPPPHDQAFDPDYDGALDASDFLTNPAIATVDPADGSRVRQLSDRDLEHVLALYAGELAWTDAQIGRVLERLDDQGLADETLVIATADHGDEFFEHGGLGHRRTLYEEVVRAPLLLRLPGVLPAGVRIGGLVSTVDILPTVLDLVGIDPPDGLASSSFRPLIEGAPDERSAWGRIVVQEDGQLAVRDGSGTAWVPARLYRVVESYRRGPIKVTRERRTARALADLAGERAASFREAAAQLEQRERLHWIDVERFPHEPEGAHSEDFDDPRARAVLREFRERYAELSARRGQPGVAEPDARTAAALRALGYVEPDAPSRPVASDAFALPPPGEGVFAPGETAGDP